MPLPTCTLCCKRGGESSGCRTEQQSVWSIKRHGAILLQRDPGTGSSAVSLYTTTQSGFRRRAHGSSCNDASPVKDVRVLSRITTEAFNQRRKTIRNSLGNLFSVEVLTEWGSTRRCERKISLSRNIARWRTIWRRTRLFRRVNDDQFAPSVYSGSKRLH